MVFDTASIPTDVWEEILKDQPFCQLKTVSLVCHNLRSLMIPRLFAIFRFTPYIIDHGDKYDSNILVRRISLPLKAFKNAVEKLLFFVSDSVSPYVRSCYVAPHDKHKGFRDRLLFGPDDLPSSSDPTSLLESLLKLLSRFSGLQLLQFNAVTFNALTLTQLALHVSVKSNINVLKFAACNLMALSLPLPIIEAPVVCFECRENVDVYGAHNWLSILDPNTLQVLQFGPGCKVAEVFTPSTSSLRFPRVIFLTIPLDYCTVPRLTKVLQLFPSLRSLRLAGMARLPGLVSNSQTIPEPLPPIREYNGPYELFDLLMATQVTLLKLSLDNYSIDGCDPDALTTKLLSCSIKIKDVEELKIKLSRLPTPFLPTVLSLTPKLRVLGIRSDTYHLDSARPFTTPEVLETLSAVSLPPNLEILSLHWSPTSIEDAKSQSTLFANRVHEQLPQLQIMLMGIKPPEFGWLFMKRSRSENEGACEWFTYWFLTVTALR
ncbi:hypothetical protein DXG01_003524 [Tephrocybe rancida]|nr:hypothetical protein DXG01_003524 [Tephrocybe rancida]